MTHEHCGTYFTVTPWHCPYCGLFWCPRCRTWFAPEARVVLASVIAAKRAGR